MALGKEIGIGLWKCLLTSSRLYNHKSACLIQRWWTKSAQNVCGAAGGRGAWAAIDPIGGDIAAKITASLRDDGELLVYSLMTVPTTNVGIHDILFRGVKVGGCPRQRRRHRIWYTRVASARRSRCDRMQGATLHGAGGMRSSAELRGSAQVRGFWLGPWMQKESGDPQRVLRDTMALLADGTIVPEAGALLTASHGCVVRAARLSPWVAYNLAVMQASAAGISAS